MGTAEKTAEGRSWDEAGADFYNAAAMLTRSAEAYALGNEEGGERVKEAADDLAQGATTKLGLTHK